MNSRRYSHYKNSGVNWLGTVPAHWSILPFKRLIDIQNGQDHKAVMQADGFPVFGSGGVFAYASDYLYDGEAILLGRKGTIDKPLYVTGKFWTVDTMYWSKIRPGVCGKFAYYVALSIPFDYYSTNTALPSMTKSALNSHLIAYPPLEEQTAICAFLDRETRKIDELIVEQEKLVTLLAEKRQATIVHAVTRGLRRDAPMKDSGVAWMGKIPAHWGVCQSRRMFSVRSEPALASDRMLTASQKYGVLFQSDFVEMEGRRVVEVIMGVENLKHVEPNDFIISMRSFQGGIEWCKLRGSTSFHYVMLKPIKGVHPPFFAHLLKSMTYVQALRATTDLIRDGQELRYSNFTQVDLPLVPLEEQKAIAEFLDRELSKFDKLSAEAITAIELLRERRKALVSAAVTGQIDARGTVALTSDESALAA
ncbi:restriction endonuclease subunit S [Burkholderia pseudomallei]|uniref:restriction endonuclease subunit S n=1 Tax=Burkholderia pseudomallei TaxID=28450 RepID=UPI003140A4AA